MKAQSIFYLLFCIELWHYHNSTLHKHIVLPNPDLLVPDTGFNVSLRQRVDWYLLFNRRSSNST